MRTADERAPTGPLGAIRVLDLTQCLAGPYATKLLADYGAEVLKIERPPFGDPARAWGPMCRSNDGEGHSAVFTFLNTNKQSLMVDLERQEGRDLLIRLIAQSDVVVENFRPGVMKRLGFDYEELRLARPDVILVSISNYGQTSSFRDYEATELNVFALGGGMALSGIYPRPPIRLIPGSSLFLAGNVAAAAVLAALRRRRHTGAGDHIDVSIANVLLGMPDRSLCLSSYRGEDAQRVDAPKPFQSFPASDGFVVINVNRGIERIAEMIGEPDLAADPRFASGPARLQNAEALEAIIIGWTVERTKTEIVDTCARYRVIAAPVASTAEVLQNSHLHARSYFSAVSGASCPCQATQPGPPFRLHGASHWGWTLRRVPLAPGGDGPAVVQRVLHCGEEQIKALIQAGTLLTPHSEAQNAVP